jgi:hypothetical protein
MALLVRSNHLESTWHLIMSPQPNPFDRQITLNPTDINVAIGTNRFPRKTLKDELDGLGITLPEDDEAAVQARAAELCSSLKPHNAFELWLTEQIALEEIQARRLRLQQLLHRKVQARRAAFCWDDERRLEAEKLAADLARKPAVGSRQLQWTKQGCDALLERWRGLERTLRAKGGWTEEQRSLALDLLGVPKVLRDGATVLDPAPGVEALDLRQQVVRQEIERLERIRAERLHELDEAEQALAEQGAGPPDPTLILLMRLEAACQRRLQWAKNQFKNGRHDYEPWASTPLRPGRDLRKTPATPEPEDPACPAVEPHRPANDRNPGKPFAGDPSLR